MSIDNLHDFYGKLRDNSILNEGPENRSMNILRLWRKNIRNSHRKSVRFHRVDKNEELNLGVLCYWYLTICNPSRSFKVRWYAESSISQGSIFVFVFHILCNLQCGIAIKSAFRQMQAIIIIVEKHIKMLTHSWHTCVGRLSFVHGRWKLHFKAERWSEGPSLSPCYIDRRAGASFDRCDLSIKT